MNAWFIDKGLKRQCDWIGGAALPDDACATLAEADRRIAVAPAMRAEDDLVTVLEIGARFAGMQGDRALAGMAQLVHAPPSLFALSGDCAAAEEIAGQQIAAAAGVMRNKLRDGPIQIQRVAARHPVRFEAFFAHLLCQEQ